MKTGGLLYGYLDSCDYRLYRNPDIRHHCPLSHDARSEEIMSVQAVAYFLFGLSLVVLFGIIIRFYYSGKRHKNVEEAKYRMFDDED